MRFSKHYRLGRVQAELDFVDIELSKDQPLFIDPYALQIRSDPWSVNCTQIIKLYFRELIDAIRKKDDDEALRLLSCLHEPKETRLGLSKKGADGNAIGPELATSILDALKESKAVKTGFLTDLADAALFVKILGAIGFRT